MGVVTGTWPSRGGATARGAVSYRRPRPRSARPRAAPRGGRGAPSARAGGVAPAELEGDDAGLRQVVERVVRHYLAGDRVDLAADLARGAALTMPTTPTRLVEVASTTWAARPNRVAAAITAAGPGSVRLDLRYELNVVRPGGRWLVRGIQVNPLDREQHQ